MRALRTEIYRPLPFPNRAGARQVPTGGVREMSDQQPSPRGREPTTENFIEDFGPFQSNLPVRVVRSGSRPLPPLEKRQRFQTYLCRLARVPEHRLRDLGGRRSTCFVRHTYLATLAKLIAYLRIAGAQTATDVAQTHAIFAGKILRTAADHELPRARISSRGWRARLWLTCTQMIAFRLAEPALPCRLTRPSRNFLKELSSGLVDAENRHGLGEYYTPDWLAAACATLF